MQVKQILVPDMPSFKELEKYLRRIDESKIYSNFGPLYKELVSRLSELWGLTRDNVCIIANGTLALEGAIAMSNAQLGSWICPSWSFAATGISLRNQNKHFYFEDVDDSWRILPTTLTGVSGIMDVAPFGDSVDTGRFKAFNGIHIVDAAASFDSLCTSSFHPLPQNVAIILSLHATKLVGAGEGGVFISQNTEWVSRVQSWSCFGFRNASRESTQAGINAKFSEYSAAVALASLDSWPARRERLLEIQNHLMAISLNYGLELHPAMRKGFVTPYWIVKSTTEHVLKLQKYMLANGYQTRKWWGEGMHRMPLFSDVAHDSLVYTELLAKNTIGLPFHSFLTKSDLKEFERVLSKSQ